MAQGLAGFIRRGMSWDERLAAEGYPYAVNSVTTGTIATNTTLTGASMLGLTRAMWLENVVVSSNKNAMIQVSISSSALGGSGYSFFWQVAAGPSYGSVVIPVRRLLRPGAYTNAAAFGGAIKNLLDADGTSADVRLTFIGVSLTDDINYTADKVWLALGDSIVAGGTGITKKYTQYDWQLRKYLRDQGINIRLLNQAISGTTSQDFETMRLNGYFDHAQVDLLTYHLGMNDAAQSLSASTYQTNVANMIAWKQQRYPNAKMIVFGGTPAENNTTETNAVTMRTNAQAAVAAANDPNVMFINLGSAFDRTQGTTVYASTDPAGSRIHPNDTGHSAIFAVIKSALDAAPSFRP